MVAGAWMGEQGIAEHMSVGIAVISPILGGAMPTIGLCYINIIISHLHNFGKYAEQQLTNYLHCNQYVQKRPKSFG